MSRPGRESLNAALDLCECGHSKERHWMHFGGPGTCSASVDVRHPATGGDGLKPCPCKGYLPMVNEPLR